MGPCFFVLDLAVFAARQFSMELAEILRTALSACPALLAPVSDEATGIFESVDPQAAPRFVVRQLGVRIAARTRDKVGVAGTAGGLSGGLVAQVQRPAALSG